MNKLIISFAIITVFVAKLQAQQVSIIDYSYESLDTSTCNVFATAKIVDGYLHRTNRGRPKFKDNSIKLDCQYISSNDFKTNIYSVQFPFKQKFRYKIELYFKPTATTGIITPLIGFNFHNSNGGIDSAINCVDTSIMSNQASLSYSSNPGLPNSYSWTKDFINYVIPSSITHFRIAAFPSINQTSVGSVFVRAIQIQEIPPPFTLSPSSVQIQCGTTVTKVFKVKNVDNVQATINYNWNLGSASNGWLMNGSPAPQTFTTTVDSIILTSTLPASAVSNVSATVNFDGHNLPILTSSVSAYTPIVNYTILGDDIPCVNQTNTYTLQQTPPAGTTVNWTISPNDGTVTLTPNGNSVVVDATNANLGGAYYLYANIVGNCYLGNASRNFIIPQQSWTGSILAQGSSWNSGYSGPLVEGDNYLYRVNGATYFEIWCNGISEIPLNSGSHWQYVSGNYASYNMGTNSIAFDTWVNGGFDSYYYYNFTDNCGTHSIPYHFVTTWDNPPNYRIANNIHKPSLKITPNPASDFINLSVSEPSKNNSKYLDMKTQISQSISIYNQFGKLQFQTRTMIPKQGLRLNISNLRKGEVYNVIAIDNKGNSLNGKFIKL